MKQPPVPDPEKGLHHAGSGGPAPAPESQTGTVAGPGRPTAGANGGPAPASARDALPLAELGPPAQVGISEQEWRDDPAALADWGAWLQTVEPLEWTPEEEANFARFRERMRQFNVEAVRRQMGEGAPG